MRISRRNHGMLDYITAGALFALPRAARWPQRVTDLLTLSAIGTLAYSLLTRYEFGVARSLSFRQHLELDKAQGIMLLMSPALLWVRRSDTRRALFALGAFELAVTMLTEPEEMSESPNGAAQSARSTPPGQRARV